MLFKKNFIKIIIKIIVAIIFCIFIFFPNPVKLYNQLCTYSNPEKLIQTDFEGIETINAEIDSLLPGDFSREQEIHLIEKYVYQHIRYRYDWDLWMNADYWPTAKDVWQKGYEDCDGRAVLAASILRSRGFNNVELVASTVHIWVKTDSTELMGPDVEKIVEYKDGKTKVNAPSWKTLLRSSAFSFHIFPYTRIMILVAGILLIFLYPIKKMQKYIIFYLLSIFGYVLLLDWAKYVVFYNESVLQFKTIWGVLLMFGPILAALFRKQTT